MGLVAVFFLQSLSCGGEERAHSPSQPEPPRRPRLIVLISLDTLRSDHLGVYGYDRDTSPNLDRFGREGVVFEDASATSPWTLPSHATMMTGLFPARHGVVASDTRLPPRTQTLAEALGDAGYETFAVVNTPWLQRDVFGFMKGFRAHSTHKLRKNVAPGTDHL